MLEATFFTIVCEPRLSGHRFVMLPAGLIYNVQLTFAGQKTFPLTSLTSEKTLISFNFPAGTIKW